MSSTGVAPPIVLDGPLPRPPLHSLVTVAQEAPADAHWRAGALLWPYPAGLPDAVDPCAEGTFRIKATPDDPTLPEVFPTFTAYLGEVCTARGIGDWDEFKSRANLALAARDSWALERQLVNASFMTAPSLASEATDLAGGSAVEPRAGVALLEAAIAETGQEGVIHLTPPVATYLGWDVLTNDRGTLRTAAGTPVVVGQGYHDADAPEGESDAGTGQSWVYATGPVMYRRGELSNSPDLISEALDREDNSVIYRAERDLWVGWDAQLAAAVRVDWTP